MKKSMKKVIKKIVICMSRYLGMTYSATKEYYLSVDKTKELQGKVALVTGGAGALGRAICLHLAVNGAIVYVGGRSKDTLQKAVLEIEGINGTAYPLVIDVMSEKSIENAVEQIMNETHKIDILVNCAGGSAREKWTTLNKQDIDVIDMILNSNLRGTILCTKYTAKHMIEQRSGRIINIASTTGI